MPDQAVNEMISAFAAGCMDKENFTHFYDYYKGKGDLPYKELGHLQTLSSMLPAILELEYPNAELKNKVARTLISMQDEIKEKIKVDRQKTVEVPPVKKEEEPVKHETVNNLNESPQYEAGIPAAENDKGYKTEKEPEQNIYMNTNNRLFTENVTRAPESPSFTPVWIVAALLFMGLCTLGYFGYTGIAELKETVAKSESNVASLKNELRNTSEFINRNSILIDFFNYENIWSVQITGSDPLLKISGKLFIAQNEKEALLQMNNLPTPSPEEAYQLWIVSNKQTISMGVFFIEPGSRFVKLSNIPVIPQEQIQQFKITVEPRSGSALPTGLTYAVGFGAGTVSKPAGKR
jgi:hypothetical protein